MDRSVPPSRFIGRVDDDGRVRDAFGEGGGRFAVPATPGTWGMFRPAAGGMRPETVLAAPGSARAHLYALAARRRLSPLHPPQVLAEAVAAVAAPGIDDPALDDLTHLPLVTIDEVRSRDLDQAIYLELRPGGYRLWYAIADPAWCVRPGTALFAEALARGATYYLPGLVLPMLPPALSEGTVSLNPGVERRAMVFEVDLDAGAEVVATRLRRARVRSRVKTSYEAVQAFLDGLAPVPGGTAFRGPEPGSPEPEDPAPIAASLELLREVGALRIGLAEAHGVVAFRRREIAVSLAGSDGLRFVSMADPRNDVERYNEQISLLCNVEGARYLLRGGGGDHVQPIYRIHEPPAPERLDELAGQLDGLVRLHRLDPGRWGWRQGNRSLAAYLRQLPAGGDRGTPGREARLARAVHRQAMLAGSRSLFATVPGIHYGVGAEVYARFTAPMREIVGVFVHKETWEKLAGRPSAAPPGWDDDERLRQQVIEAANRARQTQRELDREANRLVLDQLFGDDLGRAPADRRLRRGTVLGISRSKVHVGLDEPPIDVKVYLYHLAEQLGERVVQGRDGMTLRRADGTRLRAMGDEVALRVRGRDATRDRWQLELLPSEGG